MYIYDSLTQTKRLLKSSGRVNMYYCGPTVYGDIHLGNALSAVRADLIRRYLSYKAYDVFFVANWTDVDDKMIDRAAILKISVSELAEQVIPQVLDVYKRLKVLDVDLRIFATESIEEILFMIRSLLAKDAAYKIEDGIYFDIAKFPDYGKLSHQNLQELKDGARVDVNPLKRNVQDFCLWKFAKPNEPVFTDSKGVVPDGRPGWHIECSAMNYKAFGDDLVDIHLGGIDLKFPHHECEIAQSEMCFERPFVDFWCHNGYLLIDGEKMSKSLNNFKYAKDLFTEFSPLDVRYFSLATHYRAPLEFTLQAIQAAVNARYRLQNFYNFIFKYKDFHSEEQAIDELVETAYLDFEKAMDDDFQISQALAVLFDFSHQIYALDALSEQNIELIKEFLTKINSVLAIFKTDLVVSAEAKAMAEKRLQARAAKDYALSDQLRLEIRALGYEIRDSGDSYDLY